MPASILTIAKRQRKRGSINENAEKQLKKLDGDGTVTRASVPSGPSDRKSSEDADKKAYLERMRKKHYKR